MDIIKARTILACQRYELRHIDGLRIIHNRYEYRVKYEYHWTIPFAVIDRREVGRRNFKCFHSVELSNCRTVDDAVNFIEAAIEKNA